MKSGHTSSSLTRGRSANCLVKQFWEAGYAAQSGLTRTAAQLHGAMKAAADEVGILLVDGFHYLALFRDRRDNRLVSLLRSAECLPRDGLSFRTSCFCLSILKSAQWSNHFKTTRLPVRYLIYIVITALGSGVNRDWRGGTQDGGRPSRSSRSDFGSVVCGASAAVRLSLGRSVRHPQSRTSVRSNMLTRMSRRAATRDEP